MQFEEFGLENEKTMLLLPGTSCTWKINFGNVVERLQEKYHLICVNYDGFDGKKEQHFSDMLTVTKKIEQYILEKHHGRVDGAYGSSLGGSFVGILIQRKVIHIDHGFIGSSDLDQCGKFVGKIQAKIIASFLYGASTDEKKGNFFNKLLKRFFGMDDNHAMKHMMTALFDSIKQLEYETVYNQFYSDLITPLEDDINVDGTIVHIIYAMKMGEKYEKRYRKHFHNPDIRSFDMQHEAWLFDSDYVEPVMKEIDQCMQMPVYVQ